MCVLHVLCVWGGGAWTACTVSTAGDDKRWLESRVSWKEREQDMLSDLDTFHSAACAAPLAFWSGGQYERS